MFRRKEEGDASLFTGATGQNTMNQGAAKQPQAAQPVGIPPIPQPVNPVSAILPGAPESAYGAQAPRQTLTQNPAAAQTFRAPAPTGIITGASSAETARPVVDAPRPATFTAAMPAAPAAPVAQAASISTSAAPKAATRLLSVGHDIFLKGDINSCDRLFVEGKVDANVTDVTVLEVSETGSFKGTAQVDEAHISGVFDGELVVKSRLIIHTTGRVRGKITYSEIEIQRGGELTGEIKTPSSASQQASQRRAASIPLYETNEDKVAA